MTAAGQASSVLAEIGALITRRDQLLARMNAASWDDSGYREAEERFTEVQDKLAARAPALVKAVEAALEVATLIERYGAVLPGRGAPVQHASEALRQAITTALTGKAAGDD